MGAKMHFKRLIGSKNLRTNPPPSLLGITLGKSLLNRSREFTCHVGR